MDIEKVEVGFLKENCYVLKKNNKCLIIDPGCEYEKIKEAIGNLELLGILITHRHFDHIGALEEFIRDYNPFILDFKTSKEDTYKIGPFKFDVIYNPGHSNDSVTYYFKDDNVMFVGDFIFYRSVGRTDLATGSIEEMNKSIKKITKYNDAVIYPGHGKSTTLSDEIKNNPYFKIERN